MGREHAGVSMQVSVRGHGHLHAAEGEHDVHRDQRALRRQRRAHLPCTRRGEAQREVSQPSKGECVFVLVCECRRRTGRQAHRRPERRLERAAERRLRQLALLHVAALELDELRADEEERHDDRHVEQVPPERARRRLGPVRHRRDARPRARALDARLAAADRERRLVARSEGRARRGGGVGRGIGRGHDLQA